MGILVKDVMKCFPYESGELLRVVEYIVYSTPGAHGYTPRDIDRRWSLASPLERALQPFTVSEMEPISEYVSKLYSNYRDIWVKVTSHMKDAAQKRADLANRYRKGKDISEGQRVLLRDPRLRKAGGRGWHKEPSAPGVIIEKHGNKCTIRRDDGTIVPNVHAEDVLIVPEATKDIEHPNGPVTFEAEDDAVLDIDLRRSPGQMIEDEGRALAERVPPDVKPGKLERVQIGGMVAYKSLRENKSDVFRKLAEVGKALSLIHI